MEIFNFDEKKTVTVNNTNVTVIGDYDNPWFAGKAICEALGYKDPKDTLARLKQKHKAPLNKLKKEEGQKPYDFFWPFGDISYNEGKAVYISEQGAYGLINACRLPLKHEVKLCLDAFFYNLRYKHGLMDLFTFIKDKKMSIDIKSDWFQELWYPLSKKCHILGTMALLEWMGYEGENFTKRQNFKKLLDNNKIPYEEIGSDDKRFMEHPSMKRELEHMNAGNVNQKKWIVLETRDFKKAVLRLNTKNGEMIRDYYLNLEEACFDYAEYQSKWLIEKTEAERKLLENKNIKMQQENEEQLSSTMKQLAIKDKSEEELQKQLAFKDKSEEELQKQLAFKDKSEEELQRQLEEKNIELKDSQEYTFLLKEMLIKDDPITKNQVVYISTSESYAKRNRFKVGGVETIVHLKGRLSSYNSNRTAGDEWYFSDIFMVADYRNIEKRLEVLLGRFRDKKQKEILRMHYSNVQYIVEYLCKRFEEDVNLVNEKLNTFIENLNIRHLRPVVPPPIKKSFALVARLTEDGKLECGPVTADSNFVEKIGLFLKNVSPTRDYLYRKDVFDELEVKRGRREKTPILEMTINKLRPDIRLLVKK